MRNDGAMTGGRSRPAHLVVSDALRNGGTEYGTAWRAGAGP